MGSGLAVIIAAGGSGQRFGRAEGKQLAPLAGAPVLSRTVSALDSAGAEVIVVVCPPMRLDEYRSAAIEPLTLHTPVVCAAGGATRQESVALGLRALPDAVEIVAVHDGARPLVTVDVLDRAVALLRREDADGVVVGHLLYDTLKRVEDGRVVETLDRSSFWAAQTPQVFRRSSLCAAHDAAVSEGFVGTDDAAVVENWGGLVLMLEGPRDNIKITAPEDRVFAEAVLARRAHEGGS